MSTALFTNVLVYRLDAPLPLDQDVLNAMLRQKRARYLLGHELSHAGFIEPLGTDAGYIEKVTPGVFYLATCTTERIIPGKVIRQAIAAKVQEVERDQVRKVYSKEKAQIKDDVVQALAAKAFVVHSQTNALVAFPYVFVEATSAKKAEDLLSLLRSAIGSLNVRRVSAEAAPALAFTSWTRAGMTQQGAFRMGEAFQSRGTLKGGATLSGKNLDMSSEDLRHMLSSTWMISRLALSWTPSGPSAFAEAVIPVTVDETLAIKGIRWPEELRQKVLDDCGEDPHAATELRATLLLVGGLLTRLVVDLLDVLGGEERLIRLDAEAEDAAEDLV